MSISPVLEIVCGKAEFFGSLKLFFAKSAGFEVYASTDKHPGAVTGDEQI